MSMPSTFRGGHPWGPGYLEPAGNDGGHCGGGQHQRSGKPGQRTAGQLRTGGSSWLKGDQHWTAGRLYLRKQFSDQTPPIFVDNRPNFETGDSSVKMYLMLDRPGDHLLYGGSIRTVTTEGEERDGSEKYHFSTDKTDYEALPKNGENDPGSGGMEYPFNHRTHALVYHQRWGIRPTHASSTSIQGGATEVEKIVQDLEVKTDYIAYFVIQGSSSQVYWRSMPTGSAQMM